MVFLDTNTVIYLIEQPPDLGDKAKARVAALLALVNDSRSAIWCAWSAR